MLYRHLFAYPGRVKGVCFAGASQISQITYLQYGATSGVRAADLGETYDASYFTIVPHAHVFPHAFELLFAAQALSITRNVYPNSLLKHKLIYTGGWIVGVCACVCSKCV
jgi:hypothetical protein